MEEKTQQDRYKELCEFFSQITFPFEDENQDRIRSEKLMAHYTSLATFEKILSSGELWFSHPLQMNDYSELIGGLDFGYRHIFEKANLDDYLGTKKDVFRNRYVVCENKFKNEDSKKTYVFCTSELYPVIAYETEMG